MICSVVEVTVKSTARVILDSMSFKSHHLAPALLLALSVMTLQGCATAVGTAVGVTTTVAVEVVKVPFKVTGAAVDLMTDDEEDD